KVDWKHMGIGLPSHASAHDPCCQSGQAAKRNQLPLKLRLFQNAKAELIHPGGSSALRCNRFSP
ncbi:hypothetical protein KUCAC02_027499, partial [Chaenocephalus aceratus]